VSAAHVGEISAILPVLDRPSHTTRYAPVPECGAEFDAAPLEFRVGDPYGKVGWWSDSAFTAPNDRIR
jgi:hypothetical protein